MLNDMSEADKQWLRTEIRSALKPIVEEMRVIKEELAGLKKQLGDDTPKSGSFAYAYAHTQAGTGDEQAQAARRAEATTLYGGAAAEKKEKESGSDEVVRSGETD